MQDVRLLLDISAQKVCFEYTNLLNYYFLSKNNSLRKEKHLPKKPSKNCVSK